jgi:hypothetical protein
MIDWSGVSNGSLAARMNAVSADLGRAIYDANADRPGAVDRVRDLAARKRELAAEMKRRGLR